MAFVRSSISIAAMLSAVILAGCGGDTSETDASEAPAASATSSTTAAASAPDADATPLPTEQVFSGAELAEAMVARNDQITIEATDDGVLISGMVDNPRSSGDLLDSATVELSSGFEEFVTGLELREDSRLGNNGIMISGGQRQRIAIARELYKDIAILLMDEATSSLDFEAESLIQKNIEFLKGTLTMVIATHRVKTIENCNKVISIKDGRVTVQENVMV